MFEPSVACIEKITLKGRLGQNKISHGLNEYDHPNNHDAKSWLETKGCTPTVDTHRSFFVKKGKKIQ